MASKESNTSDSVEMVEIKKSDKITDNGITNFNSSNKDEKYTVSVNVSGYGNCIFLAMIQAFLFPVKDDDFIQFKSRLAKLFPIIGLEDILDILDLIKKYDPLKATQKVLEKSIMDKLVTSMLRTRVVKHMKRENIIFFEELIQEAIQTECRWENESIESYFKQMVKQAFTAI
jgi:hypothetical protein